ncbi:S8 family serine peptidase [Actinomadura sp. WMMB 499]|uniref:S8 family serine peptidase n=1 Tax=Actinomadura sp. WMMB 499 TaxID=1219491 RepID=UPI001244C979|nr:S8 family serine peptidase [Actinomadura sp. WMMB 499]QFG21679.1 S8 family serine peptidase [Actinomadura sp. WMMB 499]
MRGIRLVTVAALVATIWPVTPFDAAAAAAAPAPAPSRADGNASCNLPQGFQGTIPEPWAQQRLTFRRVWPLTRGGGVTVAVIDSGADTAHPMLAGRIAAFTDLTGTEKRDCAGHGTGVAALIAGRDLRAAGTPVSGVAPDAELVIVKQQNTEHDETGGDRLPGAIRKAVDSGADVINVSIAAGDSPEMREAVQYAQRRDAVVVAAAGNAGDTTREATPAYPAAHAGVISVASLGEDGRRVQSSGLRTRVDVAAPGKDIVIPWPGGGYNPQAQGTSYAAAYVSGVAALVRARHPELRQDQVVRRILETADGNAGAGTGRGMVNPVQAVTAVLPDEAVTLRGGPPGAEFAEPAPTDKRTRNIAIGVAAGTAALAALTVLGGVVIPLGRRRGWRPGKADLATRRDEDEPIVTGTLG